MARSKDDNPTAPTRVEEAPDFVRDATEQADDDDVFSDTRDEEPVAAPAPVPSQTDPGLDDLANEFDDEEMKTELRPMELDFNEFGDDDDDEQTETRNDRGEAGHFDERADVTRADPVEDIDLASLDDIRDEDDVFAEPPQTVPSNETDDSDD